jgi:hypothetical protein
VAYLYGSYHEARRPLKRAIKEAKRRAWDELLATLDSDSWGCPYRLVLNKFRPWAPRTTENMDHQFLEEVVGALFPGAVNEEDSRANGNRRSPRMSWPGLWRISEREGPLVPTEFQPASGRRSPKSWPRG